MFRDNYLKKPLLTRVRSFLSVDDGTGDEGASGGGGEAPAGGEQATAEEAAAGEGEAPAEGEAAAGEAAAGEGEAPAPKARIPWYNKRIDGLTAEKRAEQEAREVAQREATEAKAKLAAYEALYGTNESPPAAAPATPAIGADGARVYTEADFNAEAARRAENARLNDRLEGLFQEGMTKYGADWKTRIDAAGQAFGQDLGKRTDLFQALAKLPNATDVYHQLTGDLDHMAEVLTMNPVELGMELAQLSTKATVKPKGPAVSKAPAPINPINGNGGKEETLAEMSMDDYVKTREKQIEERRAARD